MEYVALSKKYSKLKEGRRENYRKKSGSTFESQQTPKIPRNDFKPMIK